MSKARKLKKYIYFYTYFAIDFSNIATAKVIFKFQLNRKIICQYYRDLILLVYAC